MSKHTPGPWEIVYRDDEDFKCMTVITQKGAMGNRSNCCRLMDDPNQSEVVAVVFHQMPPYASIRAFTHEGDEDEGNAALIAAAPELLDALERIVEVQRQFEKSTGIKMTGGDPMTVAIDAACTVIAKAMRPSVR